MKIRIKGNSIRFRLTKTEVENFCKNGYYEESTPFDQKVFTYALQMRHNIKHLEVDFTGDTISLFLPDASCKDWANSDRVGFNHKYKLQNGEELLLLLEKDFTCLDETIEDQSDQYPNPMADKKYP